MIYKPYRSSLTQPGAFLFKRPDPNHAFQRKKSHSIKPVLHFSPFKPTENPQERQKKDHFPQEKKLSVRPLKSLTTLMKQPTESMVNLRINQKHSSNAFHNLSTNNLRTTFSPVPFARRERQLLDKSKDKAKQFDQKHTDHKLQFHRCGKLALKKEEKKCKQTPSFIKNKNNHSGPSIDDFRIVTTLRQTEQYKENVVLHSKTHALFTLKSYKKAALRREKQLCDQIKFYLKNLQISHNLIVKCFGCFHDNDHLYLLEEFLQGETIWEFMSQRRQPLNQQEIGPKVCEILTALTYLSSLQLSYGNLTQRNIMHTQNVCKLKRPYLVYQGKDLLFDIWCLGKLVYEMVTLCSLVEQHLLEGVHRVQQLFSSKDIVLALEVGFKRFQGNSISRELMAFLVATLWEIQSEKLTLWQIWQLDFVRQYRQEDIWPSPPSTQ